MLEIEILSLVHSYVVASGGEFWVEKIISPTSPKLQTTISVIGSTCAGGLTVIVKVSGGPVLLLPPFSNVGVTTTVVVTGLVPVFVAVNSISSPPLNPKLTVSSEFVQVYVVIPPVFIVENGIFISSPSETTILLFSFTCAVGLTVISKGVAGPVQLTPPFSNVGVTVIVAVTGLVPVLVAAVSYTHLTLPTKA